MTIVLYGASGYTGRLVASELARHDLDHVLSGRDRAKLAQLEAARAAPIRAAALDDEPALRALLADASVVINCAGPFTLAGDALVRTAIETGTHYVDSTGEQSFVRRVFEHHGGAAERAGVALVPALGFDYTPGDCIAHLAARDREPLAELVIAYAMERFGMSRGTIRSGLEMMKGGDVVYEDGRWQAAPGGVFRASFPFPEPLGRQSATRFHCGEVITVPRHTRTRRLTSLITTRSALPNPMLAATLPFLQPGLSRLLDSPLRPTLSRAAGLLPVGPGEDERRAAAFTIVADARGEDGSTRRGIVRGVDVYGLTAVTLVHGAQLLGVSGYDRAGALGPAAAFDPAAFLDRLRAHGLSWELDP